MDIFELLKETSARISLADSWLFYSGTEEYCVLKRPPYARKNTCLYQGTDFEIALRILASQEVA